MQPEPEEAERRLESWIREHAREGYQGPLDRDLELFRSGVLDSMSFIALTAYVEELKGKEIEPEELSIDKFGSIAAIVESFFAPH